MKIQFNGEHTDIDGPISLGELLARRADLPENFAVAINETFVPRAAYDDTPVAEGDQVELVVPMQGG